LSFLAPNNKKVLKKKQKILFFIIKEKKIYEDYPTRSGYNTKGKVEGEKY
jgi:hypothetical protein